MVFERAQMTCAAIVANLEGKHLFELPIDIIAGSSLQALERRTRVLEGSLGIIPPPANLEPTWDSLAYRICRVQHKSSDGKKGDVPISSFADMVPEGFDVSLQTLKNFCLDLPRPRLGEVARPWPKLVEDEELMEYIRQTLCHEVGREKIIMKTIPITKMEVYAQIIALTVKRDTPPLLPIMAGRPPGWRIPPPPMKTKPCCGCCSCYCHETKDDISSITDSVRSVRKSTFGFGWLKKLAFWRRSKANDRASISSRGTSTIVDEP